jgi:hypothetical protein
MAGLVKIMMQNPSLSQMAEESQMATHLARDEFLRRWSAAYRTAKQFELRRMYQMIEDDMSHMEGVFLQRQLPFKEYIVESNYHSMTREIIDKTCAAETTPDAQSHKASALRNMMEKYGLHFQAKYVIPCKGGAVFNVSVISGKMFYSRIDAPYEIMGPSAGEEDGDDPRGYQTEEDLMVYLAKLVSKAEEY